MKNNNYNSTKRTRMIARGVRLLGAPLFLALALTGGLSAEETVPFDPAIREVTVYPDRALLVRQASVTLQPGKFRLVFRDAAPSLERDSLRAFSEDRDVIVQGIASYLERSPVTINDKVRGLEAEVEKLEREADRLRLVRNRLRRDLAGIQQYYTHLQKSLAEQSAVSSKAGDGPAAWQKARKFLLDRRIKTQRRLQSADEKVRVLSEKMTVARRKLAELKTGAEKARRIVEISVRVTKKTSTQVGFSYMIRQAGWNVSYGLQMASPQRVDVDYYGNVYQRTGEDWKKVRLNLSVSQPALGAERPKLRPLTVKGIEVKTQQVIVMKDEKEKEEETRTERPVTGEGKSEDTGIKSDGAALVFQIKRAVSIPSGSRSRRVTIARFNVPPKDVHYRVVGERRRAAYLATRLPNTQPFPLMAGPADIFRSSGFIGRSRVVYTPAGSEFLVGFGLERSLRINRSVRRREKSSGLLSSDRVFQTNISLTVANPGTEARRVSIFERLPVSELEEVTVTIDDKVTTPAHKETRKGSGILRWDYDLKPGEKRSVKVTYEVRAPKRLGLKVYGK